MPNELDPICDQWYAHLDKGQLFFVSAVDVDSGTVEMQQFDGDLEEVTLEEWQELDIVPCADPENWSGAFDVGNIDDLGTEVTDTTGSDWNEAQEEFRSSTV